MAQQVNYSYSSSDDEAPEEESLQVSQQRSEQQERKAAKATQALNAQLKQKRREREATFTKQKRKLLSEILQEEVPEPEEHATKPRVQIVRHTVKKLEAEKQGFKLKVHKSTTKLPPSNKALLARKERFLQRKRK